MDKEIKELVELSKKVILELLQAQFKKDMEESQKLGLNDLGPSMEEIIEEYDRVYPLFSWEWYWEGLEDEKV